jgi:hypothetical protein
MNKKLLRNPKANGGKLESYGGNHIHDPFDMKVCQMGHAKGAKHTKATSISREVN